MSTNPRSVYVSTSATEALGEPQFVIEHDGKIYLSVAVLEFDPGQPEASRLQTMLSSGSPVKATVYTQGPVAFFANAEPDNR